jgi:hypothetical protein
MQAKLDGQASSLSVGEMTEYAGGQVAPDWEAMSQ